MYLKVVLLDVQNMHEEEIKINIYRLMANIFLRHQTSNLLVSSLDSITGLLGLVLVILTFLDAFFT